MGMGPWIIVLPYHPAQSNKRNGNQKRAMLFLPTSLESPKLVGVTPLGPKVVPLLNGVGVVVVGVVDGVVLVDGVVPVDGVGVEVLPLVGYTQVEV